MATKDISSVSVGAPKLDLIKELNGAKKAKDANKPQTTGFQSPSDAVNLSQDARGKQAAHAKALDIARNTPDVREDRVAALKAKIKDGSYQVDSGKIADGMVREAIVDHLAGSEKKE